MARATSHSAHDADGRRGGSKAEAAGLRLELRALDAAIEQGWRSLADRVAAPPFLHPGWLDAWQRAFAPGRLRVIAAWDGTSLVGVLPILKRRGVYSSPTNWHTPLFGPVAGEEQVRLALVRELLMAATTRADLSFVDSADPMIGLCERLAGPLGRRVLVRTIQRSPYVELGGRTWSQYRGSLQRKSRKEAERLGRRLGELGSVSLEFVQRAEDIHPLLEEGFRMEASGWKQAQGTAIVSDQATLRFYRDVADLAHARGELVLAFLRLDGRAIAFDFCLEARGKMYVLKGGFDPSFRRFGPGVVLTYESLRRGFELGLGSYELLGDADTYKLSWTDTVRERVRLQAFGRSAAAILSRMAWTHGRNAALRFASLARRCYRRPGR